MKTDAVRVRIDPEVKAQAEAVLKQLGVTPSAAISMFYRQIAGQGGLPFAVKIPTPRLEAAFTELDRPEDLPVYATVRDMMDALDADGEDDAAHSQAD